MDRVNWWDKRRWSAAVLPVVQALESRICLTAIVPGWSETAGGFTLSFQSGDSETGADPQLIVQGTDGPDVVKLGIDPTDPSQVRLELNGSVLEFVRGDVGFRFDIGPQWDLLVTTGGGNDTIEDDLPGGVFKSIILDGGAGNDTILGMPSVLSPFTGPDGIAQNYGSSEQIFGGDGDDLLVARGGGSYISGGAGDDNIFAGVATQEALSDSGNDVIHGSPNGSSAIFGRTWIAKGNGAEDVSTSDQLRLGDTIKAPTDPSAPSLGDRQLPAGGGAGSLVGAGVATLIGDVLVIHGTAGADTAHLWTDSTGAVLDVSVNGVMQSFNTADVGKFAFDAQGGNDQLIIHDGAGIPTGWIVRTANPADTVAVTHSTDPGPTNVTVFQPPPPPQVVAPPVATVPKDVTAPPPAPPVTVSAPPLQSPPPPAPPPVVAPVTKSSTTVNKTAKPTKVSKPAKPPKAPKAPKPPKPPKAPKPPKVAKAVKLKVGK